MADKRNKTASAEEAPKFPSDLKIVTREMHTGGEPFRIIEAGYPEPEGKTILEKRAWLRACADHYRTLVMSEPRGHGDMFGALLVTPDLPEADLGIIFMHNEGYSPMCGHGVIALGRYAIDKGLVAGTSPETRVVVQCPCGPVTAHVTYHDGVTSDVRFTNVPSYVFALDVDVEIPGLGQIRVDIVWAGAFYALVPADRLGLDLETTPTTTVSDTAFAVTKAVAGKVKLHQPDSPDLAFLYGTIVTDGGDHFLDDSNDVTSTICVFAGRQVDRSPCGSGTAARVALQHHRKTLPLMRKRQFRSAVTGSKFTARALREVEVAGVGREGEAVTGVVVEVAGRAFYSGTNIFCLEAGDPLATGFLPR